MSAPPPFGYYDAPTTPEASPGVILFVRLYAAVMALAYVAGVFALALTPTARGAVVLVPVLVCTASVLLAALHVMVVFMPRKPASWTFGLVALGFGMVSCGIVFAIPLLVYWLRPECRAAFMRA